MSLTSGVFHVHAYINKFVPLPYHLHRTNQRFETNQSYDKHYFKIFRTSVFLTCIFVYLPTCTSRFTWLLFRWSSYSSHNIEQFFMYGVGTCFMLIFVPVYIILRTQSVQIILMMNQVCQLGSIYQNIGTHKYNLKVPILGKPTVPGWFPFIFSVPFVLVLPTFFYIPFLFPYLPLQLMFGQSTLVKTVSAIVYCCTVAYGASNILSVLLVAIVFLENVILYMSNILRESAFSTKIFFVVSVRGFRNAHILIELFNEIYSLFFTNLIFVGILLASCCSYTTTKMYNRINIIAYLSNPCITISCFGIALLLTPLANIPFNITKLFRKKWSLHLTKKEHQRMIATCKPFGFQLGIYGTVSAKLGLSVCDDIVRNTVAVILLKTM